MIENELLFLGLLKDGPKHGYEIRKIIDEDLFPLVGLKIKSIYYPLNKMEKLGLVKKDIDRAGKFPEKYVYQLTKKGESVFETLITDSFLSIERPYFQIDLSLYFLPYVDKKIALKRLRVRASFLKKIRKQIETFKASIKDGNEHFKVILDHNLDLVDTEIKSIIRFKEVLSK